LHSETIIPPNYKAYNKQAAKAISIQIPSFDVSPELSPSATEKVNRALTAASDFFYKEAKACGAAAQGHPWRYELVLDKVLLAEKYLSVVFTKSTVCAGSPDIEKEARVFSLPTGSIVRTRALFKQIFPAAKLIRGTSTNTELIGLDEELAET
jgi:hypothetical protein